MFHQPKTFEVFKEASIWNSFMDLANVGDVNEQILSGNASDLIRIAEALQEKKIVRIAEEIEKRHSDGENPVSARADHRTEQQRKSTFCKRLSTKLKPATPPGLIPTDDYSSPRGHSLLPDGSYDFDNFETVDYRCLQSDLLKLLGGEEVDVRSTTRDRRERIPRKKKKLESAPSCCWKQSTPQYRAYGQGPRAEEIQDIHQRHNLHLPGQPQLHPDKRQPPSQENRARLPQGSLQRPRIHRQLA